MSEAETPRDPRRVDYGELPELTRGLRALGSFRRGGGMQSLLFHPLIEARRRAADARTPHGRIRAFDATDLARALERAVDRIVEGWPDERPPARRALRAELIERLDPYSRALRELSQYAADAIDAAEADQLNAWQAWTGQLSSVFTAADRCWLAIRPVVESVDQRRKDRG